MNEKATKRFRVWRVDPGIYLDVDRYVYATVTEAAPAAAVVKYAREIVLLGDEKAEIPAGAAWVWEEGTPGPATKLSLNGTLADPLPLLDLDLTRVDANAFVLLGEFSAAAKRAGWPSHEIKEVRRQAMAADYTNLVGTLAAYCKPKRKRASR